MSQPRYLLYRSDVFNLARSIVIKFGAVADTINTNLKNLGYSVNADDPTTWKYYLNLAGEYHAYDTMMYVKSMDTLESIAFTKENLAIHRATAREYVAGTVYYKALVDTYPEQVDLINGIISPIDIEKAIESDDGSILYYNTNLVESNEDNLIDSLQWWVKEYHNTWYNEQFLLTDDLYLATYIGILYLYLPCAIFNIRLRNCKTRQAHSFHITEYLASRGGLDAYIPYLNLKQRLWLYRNIDYIRHYAGRQSTFNTLMQNLLTERGIPLLHYWLKQNVSNMPQQLYPDAELVVDNLNFSIAFEPAEKATIPTLLEREDSLARDNPVVRDATLTEVIDKVKSDQYSLLPTKVLDSNLVDRTNASVRTLTNVLLNEWLHLSTVGRYTAYVTVQNPSTGDTITVTAKNAFIIAMYCFMKANGLLASDDSDVIPEINALRVLRNPLPNFQELSKLVDPKHVKPGLIQAIQDRISPLTHYISIDAFYAACNTFHRQYLDLWQLYSLQESYYTQVMCKQVVFRHYMDIRCALVDAGTTWAQYLRANSLDIASLSTEDLTQLLTDIVNTATGSNLVSQITMGDVQRELLRLMGNLSSYPLEFLRNVALTNFDVVELHSLRIGDVSANSKNSTYVVASDISILDESSRTNVTHVIPSELVLPNIETSASTSVSYPVDLTLGVRERHALQTRIRVSMPYVGIRKGSFTITVKDGSSTLSQYTNSTDPNWPVTE